MSRRLSALLLVFTCFLCLYKLYSQEISPIQTFSAEVTTAGNQNWQITQGADQALYFANNNGLIRFNGAQWEQFPTQDNSIMRSVKAIDDRIYSGNYMDFGYWSKSTTTDQLVYTSLIELLDIEVLEDEQFWKIIDFDERIVFQSLNRLIFVNTATLEVDYINCENTLLKSFKVDEQLYFQELGKGLYFIEKGEAVLLTEHPKFRTEIIVGLFKREEKLLALTHQSGFYTIGPTKTQAWSIPAQNVVTANTLYSAIELSNKGFALGTIAKGLIMLKGNGELENVVQQTNGLSNNTVLSLYEDKEKNIWLGLDNGINLINSTSPFKEYQDNFGELGTVYSSARFENRLYLGTNQGLFVKSENSLAPFRLVENTQGQVWYLTVIDNRLFCGHDRGTFVIKNNRIRKITDVNGAWSFRLSPQNNNLIVQGNYDGLHVLEKQNNQWRYRNKLNGFEISSRFFEFLDGNTIFVNHEYKGVFRVSINDQFTKVTQWSTEPSVQKSYNSSLSVFDQKLYYHSQDGIFRFNSEQDRFNRDKTLSAYFTRQNYVTGKMVNDRQGRLWLFSKDQIHFFTKDVFNNALQHQSIPFDEKNKKSLSGFENIAALSPSTFLIGGSKGYFTLDVNRIKPKTPQAYLQKIESSNVNKVRSLPLNSSHKVSYEFNNLNFEFTAFAYQKYETTRFQTQLEGYNKNWSDWSEKTARQYANLPYGDYRFKVQAKQGETLSKVVVSENIKIAPPWYLSTWSGILYALLLFLILYFYNRFYQLKMTRQEQALLEKNRQAIEVQNLENQKQLIRIKNEQLQNDIESKNRELAVATLSTLKRNEFLNDLKKELEIIKKEPKVKKLIKTINAKLNSNDDWEYFEKAFDNADQGFFKKLKNIHPSLTNNDLKLCAYLRLNMSSKEIAPLLNISVHSVEIKRYRLRKKMELTRKQNIVEYIMSV
ncbi:MAG: triple tyrosine motif-containing protein [Flavobacteriaceae bacterium]